MNQDIVRFRRRLNDPLMDEIFSSHLEEEIDENDPCNSSLKEWFENILDGTTNRVTMELIYDGIFSDTAFLNEELYKFIRQYILDKSKNRIKFTYEDRIDGCDE